MLIIEKWTSQISITVSPFCVTPETASSVDVVLDQKLLSSIKKLAVHPSDSSVTAFVTADQLRTYIESTGANVIPLDFTLTNM